MIKNVLIIITFSIATVHAQTVLEYYNIGKKAYNAGNYNDALKYYEKSADIFRNNNDKGNYSALLVEIGRVYSSLGQYNKAIEYFHDSLIINKALGQKLNIAACLNDIGLAYRSLGQYDKSIEYFNKSFDLVNKSGGDKVSVAACYFNLGLVYYSWGHYDKSLEYSNKAFTLVSDFGDKATIASVSSGIGRIYYALGQYNKAIGFFNNSLSINEELGRHGSIAGNLSDIGAVYRMFRQYGSAVDYFKKALTINEELGQKENIATSLNNIGSIYYEWGQYEKAYDYIKKALDFNEKSGSKDAMIVNLTNIGCIFHSLKKYDKSINYLKRSIDVIEELRLTAPGDIKREYISKQIYSYQWLVSSYIHNNDVISAMNTIELSSSKYLIDQLGERLKEKRIQYVDIKDYNKKISSDTVVISFSNAGTELGIATILIDNKDIVAVETDEKSFIKSITGKYSNRISQENIKQRGLKIQAVIEKQHDKRKITASDFNGIINYYHHLLSQPRLDKQEFDAYKYIASELYNLLLKKFEKQLVGKKELIILPGGIFSIIPFETLIMSDGSYLIEKYYIKYAQSLTVMDIIGKRKYSNLRSPMIAFGGATYDKINYKKNIVETEQQLADLIKETNLVSNRGDSMRNAYFSLGFGKWENLPGTLTEVKAIKLLIPDVNLITGQDVDESFIKILSKTGKLKNYKAIHFATHGIVVPEIPELSAIVLSQYNNERNGEDGYLRMQEIAALDINADFVNLSACETGLGKIYGGEGVVGLTQAFLLAGANGLSVSLWQVADNSTMEFMIGVYQKVIDKELSYHRAIAEMKREYIHSSKYNKPFFWAPFVYYGK